MHAEYSHYAHTIQPKYDTSTTALQQTLEPDTSPLDKSILYIAIHIVLYTCMAGGQGRSTVVLEWRTWLWIQPSGRGRGNVPYRRSLPYYVTIVYCTNPY